MPLCVCGLGLFSLQHLYLSEVLSTHGMSIKSALIVFILTLNIDAVHPLALGIF